ncbi:MAG: malto-oligosyltrehalose trehalohydrolase [Beijerinckiaceae bacterium]|nr:malto-oligosyltrehalose trehalohydrolase [Beijerinckiaceae bacterium]
MHRSPFGAHPGDEGVRFRFYAPDAESIDLLIDGRGPIRMDDDVDGWKAAYVSDARAGDQYAFRLPDGLIVPDPASRYQPKGLSGRSQVVDPRAYEWRDGEWRGRDWAEAVIYEAHVGTATHEGTFAALAGRLDDLAALGVTALELMPIAQWRGARNWGYDGVLPFAPCNTYGPPDDLKALIDRAHSLQMMVIIDVVYNHFGPSGNYLHSYARSFFTRRHRTPWGAAINFDDSGCDAVRAFFLHNAHYWLEEFHADGLRLDAVHAIADDSGRHILSEIAEEVRRAFPQRRVHLILENDCNQARWLERENDGVSARLFTAQWNDDTHHCWHALLTGERDGYYADFASDAPAKLARALAEGFAYQGDASAYRNGENRGEPSAHLHPCAFIDFLQNHDQIGNRAFGERIEAIADPRRVAMARAAILLCPHIPMLFMGEEWGARNPFLYFVDFNEEPGLAAAVRDGRRREFEGFGAFARGGVEDIPDPNARATFERSRVDPAQAAQAEGADTLALTRRLLRIRHAYVVPLIASRFLGANYQADAKTAFVDVRWRFESGGLRLMLNLGASTVDLEAPPGETIYEGGEASVAAGRARLPPWSVLVSRTRP